MLRQLLSLCRAEQPKIQREGRICRAIDTNVARSLELAQLTMPPDNFEGYG